MGLRFVTLVAAFWFSAIALVDILHDHDLHHAMSASIAVQDTILIILAIVAAAVNIFWGGND